MQYQEFIALYGNDPDWVKLRDGFHFEADLRRALAGDPSGFREIAIHAPEREVKSKIMRTLWRVGVQVRPHHRCIKRIWKNQSSLMIEAFGEDLDRSLGDAGFGAARLPEEFDIWATSQSGNWRVGAPGPALIR
jgi:hypothetical protein